jgi:hypothetical protein
MHSLLNLSGSVNPDPVHTAFEQGAHSLEAYPIPYEKERKLEQ